MKNTKTSRDLSPGFENLIDSYSTALEELEIKSEVSAIHVDEIASKVAVLYEKVRKIIDWKEEHLLRRAAIERILKRRLISELSNYSILPNANPQKMAEPLVLELIRGGHFLNNNIPGIRISEIEDILEKYIYVLENSPLANTVKVKERINFYTWIIEICACEIEETLDQPAKENLLLNFMTETLNKRILLGKGMIMSPEEKIIQTYIAAHRTLYNLDNSIISYHLLKVYYPQWLTPNKKLVSQITKNILEIKNNLENDLNHQHSSEFRKICEKYDTVFLIIGDIFNKLSKSEKEIKKTISQPKKLKKLVTEVYNNRLSTLKGRLTRAAIYSTLSILVASSLSLFIVEVPIAKLVYGEFSPLAITIDLLLPTLVMFLLVIAIKLPDQENLNLVIKEVLKVVYPQKEEDVYELRTHQRGLVSNIIIKTVYAITSLGSIVFIFWLFWLAKIPLTSLILDTLNVSMVVFAGLIIRQRAKELTIDEKRGFWQFILDILSVPVAKLGQWLSNKWREYNIVSVFLTILVDMPFSSLVEFIESWSTFLKEKKAELH
jgi:hypothetical protein